jgi:hypothetical protein
MLTEMRSDNTKSATLEGSKADFHRYLVEPNNVQSEDYYQSMYDIIFRANSVLAYIDVADESNQAKYRAEAKFLRAYAYFNLVRLFGDVPLVNSVTGPSENDLLFTRVAKSKIYELIISDFQDAIDNLDNEFKSRASKGAAQGLLAKVYLTQDNRNYEGAEQLCQDIINSMDYSLESNFKDVFYNELNNEILFAVEYLPVNTLESQSFSSEFTSTYRTGREDGLNIIDNPDLEEDFATYGGNRTAESYITFGTKSETIKFLPEGTNINAVPPDYGGSPRDAGNDWIVLRYADVLLMHAEAALKGGTETTSSTAIDSYMKVKVRAGFDAVSDRPSVLTKDLLLKERRVELAFENHRFFDLLRFGVADNVLGAHATKMGYSSYDARKLLLPIPSREINLSKGLLSQNPGY